MKPTKSPDITGREAARDAMTAIFLAMALLVASVQIATAQSTVLTGPEILGSPDPALEAAVLVSVVGADLSEKNRAWFRETRKHNTVALNSARGTDRERAMQNIIYLSLEYGDQVSFARSTNRLLEIWQFDPVEEYRIMALQAIFAADSDRGVRTLRTRLDQQESARVRRHTKLALAEYYQNHPIDLRF